MLAAGQDGKREGTLMSYAIKAGIGFALIAAAFTGTAAHAKDAAVEKRLAALELQYDIDSDGDYKILFGYPDEDRSQVVFVSGATQTVNDINIREFFAPAAFVVDDNINGTKALMLLENSSGNKIGSWEIRGDVLYFVAKIAEPLSAADLGTVMETVAATADDMEIELTKGGDDF
jgi:hypothetical protein